MLNGATQIPCIAESESEMGRVRGMETSFDCNL